MDIVIPVGPNPGEELRYCLRSVAAHLPHGRVWLVGEAPGWVEGVEHIPTAQSGNAWQNVKAAMRAVCEHPEVSDPFVLFNDDFYVMEPVASVPVMHLGPLAEVPRGASPGHVRCLQSTREFLVSHGVTEPLSYEVHAPMVVVKAGMWATLDLIGPNHLIRERSVYGNLGRLGGVRVDDVKVRGRDDRIPVGPFLSTSDRAFGLFQVGRHVRASFPAACRYELPSGPAPTPGPGGRVVVTA